METWKQIEVLVSKGTNQNAPGLNIHLSQCFKTCLQQLNVKGLLLVKTTSRPISGLSTNKNVVQVIFFR